MDSLIPLEHDERGQIYPRRLTIDNSEPLVLIEISNGLLIHQFRFRQHGMDYYFNKFRPIPHRVGSIEFGVYYLVEDPVNFQSILEMVRKVYPWAIESRSKFGNINKDLKWVKNICTRCRCLDEMYFHYQMPEEKYIMEILSGGAFITDDETMQFNDWDKDEADEHSPVFCPFPPVQEIPLDEMEDNPIVKSKYPDPVEISVLLPLEGEEKKSEEEQDIDDWVDEQYDQSYWNSLYPDWSPSDEDPNEPDDIEWGQDV